MNDACSLPGLVIEPHPAVARWRGRALPLFCAQVRILERLARGATARELEDMFVNAANRRTYLHYHLGRLRLILAREAPELRLIRPGRGRQTGHRPRKLFGLSVQEESAHV